jgi:glycosyltransferase involved in cell wall biosynthesis
MLMSAGWRTWALPAERDYETRAIKRLVFWEPCPSPHKADLLDAVAAHAPELEVVCCADHPLSEERIALGWTPRRGCGLRTIVAPTDLEVDALAHERPGETLHIFSGVRWLRTLTRGIRSVRASGARLAIMSEPRVREGWTGEARFLQSWATEGWLRRNARFVLAIGRNGPDWFTSVGYPSVRVFPFAYFIAPPDCGRAGDAQMACERPPIRVGYVGRVLSEKGVFDLANALGELRSDCTLAIAGYGPDAERLRRLCTSLGVSAVFHGVVPMAAIGGLMRRLDVLVLASQTSDGWGVVVSEALMCGTAVVATPHVGGSVMLDDARFGRVVPTRSPTAIAHAIRCLAAANALEPDARDDRMHLARERLSADAGARYLLEIVRWSEGAGERPPAFYAVAGFAPSAGDVGTQ